MGVLTLPLPSCNGQRLLSNIKIKKNSVDFFYIYIFLIFIQNFGSNGIQNL